MTPFVIVATRGRPKELRELVLNLMRQTMLPERIYVVGVSDDDVHTVRDLEHANPVLRVHLAQKPGLTSQRNEPIRLLREAKLLDSPSFVVFFDDDFRPADNWLEEAANIFGSEPDIVGLSGCVLADGVNCNGLSETDAYAFISEIRKPVLNWSYVQVRREVASVYGCNMAFRNTVMKACEFDEALPLYGWQEDRDMTGQARRFGKTVLTPECRGVHLGSQNGRTNGLRLGYSQVANFIYLWRKGTVDPKAVLQFVGRSLASNIIRSIHTRKNIDYRGRLQGNLFAFLDLLRGRAHPLRALDL